MYEIGLRGGMLILAQDIFKSCIKISENVVSPGQIWSNGIISPDARN